MGGTSRPGSGGACGDCFRHIKRYYPLASSQRPFGRAHTICGPDVPALAAGLTSLGDHAGIANEPGPGAVCRTCLRPRPRRPAGPAFAGAGRPAGLPAGGHVNVTPMSVFADMTYASANALAWRLELGPQLTASVRRGAPCNTFQRAAQTGAQSRRACQLTPASFLHSNWFVCANRDRGTRQDRGKARGAPGRGGARCVRRPG